jgi:hypothetical protein
MAAMLELSPYAPLYLTIAVAELLLGIYVLALGPRSPINRLFLGFIVLASAGSVLGLLLVSPIPEPEASLVARTLWFLLAVEIGLGYRLSRMVPFDSGPILMGKRSWPYAVLVLAVAFLLSMSVAGVQQDRYGWFVGETWPTAGLATAMLLYVFLITVGLWRKRAMLDDGIKKGQAGIFSFALAFPMGLMLSTMALHHIGPPAPRLFGLGEMVSVALVSYGMVKYRLFIPPRVLERSVLADGNVPTLQRGRTYLFEGQDPDRMFRTVRHEVGEGLSALIICRTHPDQLRGTYHLAHTPMIWLAESPGPDRVDPSNLQMLTHMALEFVRRGPSLVAIEGLEYLMVNNELNRVLKFIGQLRDHVIVEGNVLVVAVDPRTLTERQRAILERELDQVVGK